MNKEDYEKYYQKGGSYVIPVEVFNELLEEKQKLKKELKSYQEMYFDKVAIINDAIEEIHCWGDVLYTKFQKEILKILKGDKKYE